MNKAGAQSDLCWGLWGAKSNFVKGNRMKKRILFIFVSLICLIVPSALVIAQSNNQTEKPSAIDNTMTELKARIEQKKKELKEKNIDVNSITPGEIAELLDSNVLTINDVENIFPEEKLMKLRVSTLSRADTDNEWVLFMPALIGEALYELRYYVGEIPSGKITPKLKDAIKDFQHSLGNDATGELLFGEFTELTDRYGKLHPQHVGLPNYRFFDSGKHSIGPGYVSLAGTWVFKDGTPHAIPIQTSIIELNKSTMSGVEAMASIPDYYSDDGRLTADIIHWKIIKWDTKEIMAENDAPLNASYTLSVDLKNEKVYMFRRHKGEKIFGKLELEASILELVDGFKVSYDLYQKRLAEARELYNPKYGKNVLEQLSKTPTQNLPAQSKQLVEESLAEQSTATSSKTSAKERPTEEDEKEEIVFTGIPKIKILIESGSQRTPEKLSQAKSIEYKCTVTKMDDKYYWATRESVELIPLQSGIYTTFIATNGAGYIRIIGAEAKKVLFKKGEQPYDYMEHLLLGLSTISYYGTSK